MPALSLSLYPALNVDIMLETEAAIFAATGKGQGIPDTGAATAELLTQCE